MTSQYFLIVHDRKTKLTASELSGMLEDCDSSAEWAVKSL